MTWQTKRAGCDVALDSTGVLDTMPITIQPQHHVCNEETQIYVIICKINSKYLSS